MRKIIILFFVLLIGAGFCADTWSISCKCTDWPGCSPTPFDLKANTYYSENNCAGCGIYYFSCNPAIGSAQLTCNAGFKNCDSITDNGCETWIIGNPNACGSSCSTCSNAPCVNGLCQIDQEWARVKIYCNFFGPDEWEGIANTSSEYRKDNDGQSYSSTGDNVFCGFWDSSSELYGYGKCSTGYKDCNGGGVLDGCETDIRHFNSACGSCSLSCNTNSQWCWQGSCISKIGQDYTHGACSGTTSVCPADSVEDTSGAFGSNTCAWGGSPKCNCNSGYKNCDGVAGSSCETHISADINNCGACGRVCSTWLDNHDSAGIEVSTLAQSGQCSDYKLGGSKSMCQYSCNSGLCSALSLATGQCDTPGQTTQCVSGKTCIASLTDSGANIDNGRSWCCSSTQCSYNGTCHEQGTMIHNVGANKNSYFCSSGYKWILVGTNLNLSRMISQPRNSSLNISKVNYFADLGVTNTCFGGSACVISAAKYSYKYCFSYNIVFDGMFNIETSNNVPVKVSEQDLYNPYYKPLEIIPTNTNCITPEGTAEDILYCAVKP